MGPRFLKKQSPVWPRKQGSRRRTHPSASPKRVANWEPGVQRPEAKGYSSLTAPHPGREVPGPHTGGIVLCLLVLLDEFVGASRERREGVQGCGPPLAPKIPKASLASGG